MKIPIIADPHLGQYWRTNPRRAIKLIDNFCCNIDLISKKYSALFILGDLFHTANLPPDCMAYICEKVFPIFKRFEIFTVVVGNHEVFLDIHNHQKSLPGMSLASYGNVYETGFIKIPIENSKVSYYALPYQKDLDTVLDYLKTADFSNDPLNTVIFGHFTPKEMFERATLEVTPIFENLKVSKMFLGDYHEPKLIKIGNVEVYSIGSTYYWDISDVNKNTKKRYLVLDTDTLDVESFYLSLPKIERFTLNEESDLGSIFTNKEIIYYLESSIPYDLTQYISDGYDIYFNYLTKEKYNNLLINGEISLDESSFVNVDNSWENYIRVQQYDTNIKETANKIFNNRNTLTAESILEFLKGND